MKILVVEDNTLLGNSLKRGLEEAGWTVDLARDGEEGLFLARSYPYALLLLDWMLPKFSGLEILRLLRAQNDKVPVLLITAREAVLDKVEGLNVGADDYLVKPFEMIELIARVNALFRRSIGGATSLHKVGGLTLDLAAHRAFLLAEPMDLTGKEYDLLSALATAAGTLIKRDSLASMIYELDAEPESNSLDVLLARVRKKLSGSDVEIATIRGKGFLLRVAPLSPQL